jgi:hypothetical protein
MTVPTTRRAEAMSTEDTKVDELRTKAAGVRAELGDKLSTKLDETKDAAKDAVSSAKQHTPEPVQKVMQRASERVAPTATGAEHRVDSKKLALGGVLGVLLLVVLRRLIAR